MSDQGHWVVVTGAASGIGAAVVERLAADGYRVIALDLATETVPSVATQTLACDVADEGAVAEAFAAVAELADGDLHGLVNAAGIVRIGRFLDFSVEDWERTYRVNVIGSYLTIKYAAELLAAGSGGSVVDLSSMGGKIAGTFTAPYAASKAAVISLTRTAATTLAPAVRVNALCPGIVDTPMWDRMGEDLAAIGAPIDFESRAAQAPAGRAAQPAEIASTVAFLLSDDAVFVTGEDLNVSGGLVMH